MKRIGQLISIFVLSLAIVFAIVCSTNNYAYASDEILKDAGGHTVYYPYSNSSTAIRIPEYTKKDVEFRGVWVSAFAGDISSYQNEEQMKSQLLDVLDLMDSYNLNAIMFHLRTHNDALYPTDLTIQSPYTKNANYEEFDYVEWFINECHKRGIEFHAWLNPYRLYDSQTKEIAKAKYAGCPDNPANNIDNILINSSGEAILDPGRPEVQDYIVRVCMEVIEKYDVDAIHFDDYFYVENVDDAKTRSLYNTGKLSIENFRRDSVDKFIKKLSDEMYDYNIKNNRVVQLGISPSGIYRNTSTYVLPANYKYDSNGNLTSPVGSASAGFAHYGNYLYCDTKKWIDNEWIDYIIPQVYNSIDFDAACYAAIVEWWNGCVKNKKVNLYIGQGLYKKGGNIDTAGSWSNIENEWEHQMRFNQRNTNVKGFSVYCWKTLRAKYNETGVKHVREDLLSNKTKLPVARRYQNQNTSTQGKSVKNLEIYKSNNSVVLKWDKISNVKNYIIYQYKDSFDINDATQIIGLSGNDVNKTYSLVNLQYHAFNGDKFAVVPLTKANELCSMATTDLSKVKTYDGSIPLVSFADPYVTGVISTGSKVNYRFNDPVIEMGTSVTFKAYYCVGSKWNESEKQEIKNINSTQGLNSVQFNIDKFGYPIIVKIEATTEFGSCLSDEYMIAIKYNQSSDAFKDITNIFGYYFEEMYK